MSEPYHSPIPSLDPDPQRETPNEWTMVERPLVVQLAAMGWEYPVWTVKDFLECAVSLRGPLISLDQGMRKIAQEMRILVLE